MRFLTFLVAAQTLTTISLASPAPADPMLMPMAATDSCNSCLVTNIRKVHACSWWNLNTPWLTPGNWNQQQRTCVCALSQNYFWIDACNAPNYCNAPYISRLKGMYIGWGYRSCNGYGSS